MRTNKLIIILVLTVMLFVSCKSSPDLTENEVYDIINQIIADDSLHIMTVCCKFEDIKLTDEYKKQFTDQDITFIQEQKELFKNLEIKPNKLKWYKKHSKTSDFTTVNKVCDQGILYHISFPLISVDRQKVLIEFREDCNCMLGGQGGKDLYVKKNGHWVRTKGFDNWISDNRKTTTGNSRFKQLLGLGFL